MKGKFIASAFLIWFASVSTAVAQMDSVARDAILTLLLSKQVSEKIFVDYPEGTWGGPFSPPGGRYAFMPPNRILRSVYPTILNEMPYTTSTDGLMSMRRLYQDSIRTIFITQVVPGKLCTVFEQIKIDFDTARVDFITTSYRDKEEYRDKYVRVCSKLILTNDKWSIAELNIDQIPWTDYFNR